MRNSNQKIKKVIRKYIKYVLTLDGQVNQYVPNSHVAETFKGVLLYSELESKNEHILHNVEYEPYDSIGTNNPEDYVILEDGRYLKKETFSVGINDLLPEYFDSKRLEINGIEEIRATYQKLRMKDDIVRNNIILGKLILC